MQSPSMKPLSLQQLHHYHCKTLFYSIHLRWELYAPTHAQISNPSLLLNSEIYIWIFLELFNPSMIQMWRILCNHVTSLINLCISFFSSKHTRFKRSSLLLRDFRDEIEIKKALGANLPSSDWCGVFLSSVVQEYHFFWTYRKHFFYLRII